MGILWWALKATERLPWLTLDKFYRAPREVQVLLLTYAQERDMEDVELATCGALANLTPFVAKPGPGDAIGTRVE